MTVWGERVSTSSAREARAMLWGEGLHGHAVPAVGVAESVSDVGVALSMSEQQDSTSRLVAGSHITSCLLYTSPSPRDA